MKETDLALAVIHLLKTDHEIYQEVQTPWGVVDIVATRGPILWAIEVKTSCNLAVLGQAHYNIRYFHYSSIAVPRKRRHGKSETAVTRFVQADGIGIIEIEKGYDGTLVAWEIRRARFHRRVLDKYVVLFEEQKYWAEAGNANGKYYSSFKGTKQRVIDYVTNHPGCSIREVMESVEHHYNRLSTAMNCIRQWIHAGVISEIYIDNGKLFLRKEVA